MADLIREAFEFYRRMWAEFSDDDEVSVSTLIAVRNFRRWHEQQESLISEAKSLIRDRTTTRYELTHLRTVLVKGLAKCQDPEIRVSYQNLLTDLDKELS